MKYNNYRKALRFEAHYLKRTLQFSIPYRAFEEVLGMRSTLIYKMCPHKPVPNGRRCLHVFIYLQLCDLLWFLKKASVF